MNRNSTQLIVMAKAPQPGLAKTRLIPALGAEGAARLAASLLERTMEQARVARLGDVWLSCTPDTTHAAFAAQAAQGGVLLHEQGGGDLGARMQRMIERALATPGVQRAIVIGTDAPGLDAVVLRRAEAVLAQLEGTDAVFVPALDGGYALIGLNRAAPSLFESMPWSSARVMAMTRRRLAAAGLRHVELNPVRDIDEPDDLLHLPAGWL